MIKQSECKEILSGIFYDMIYNTKLKSTGLFTVLAIERILGCQVLICSQNDQLCLVKFLTKIVQMSMKQGLNDQKRAWIYGFFIVGSQIFCLLSLQGLELSANWRYDPIQ